MSAQPKSRPAPAVPARHPQWEKLDFAEILSYPTATLAVGYSNSLLSPNGAQKVERLWERGRLPGGALGNTIKLVHGTRANGNRMIWTRYRIFRESYPQSPMDEVQYAHWLSHYPGWTDEQKQWDCQPVDEIKALMRPDEPEVYYTSLGNVFLGTMLPAYLNMWGVRTVVLCGYHLDWCIEQAARTCRDMGYMPIVVGDAVGCGVESDEAPTLERLERFFAPVVSTDQVVELMAQGAARRKKG